MSAWFQRAGHAAEKDFHVRVFHEPETVSKTERAVVKSFTFNAEYSFSIVGQVRLIFFYDAGQVRQAGENFSWKENLFKQEFPPRPLLLDPFADVGLTDPSAPGPKMVLVGKTSAFKTSTGAEVRFFMPVLNVPFRLIFAANPQRGGVLDNSLRPAKNFTFKFAVGSTF